MSQVRPEAVAYRWYLTVSTGEEENHFLLEAERTYTVPYFWFSTCEAGAAMGAGSCTRQWYQSGPWGLPGTMTDGWVTWPVPFAWIGGPGSVISTDRIDVASKVPLGGPSGMVVFDEMTDYAAYTVPERAVRVGIAPAGTPVAEVPLTVDASLEHDGTLKGARYSGRLPLPEAAGDYTVVVQACDGADSCGIATTKVTI